MMAWILLIVTILLEVAGTISMKLSNGLTNPIPSVLLFVFYGACFALFAIAVKTIDLSIAYAIWSGAGTMLVFIIGVFVFQENLTWMKTGCIILIIIGVVGLKWSH
ncbi:DMT family transporter [Bacillus salitolerans]|uniref:DMT family transporter n=1 Tax=Bacillus salitolerans TaxID=1437434 RepID=A0ABW4LVP2_9BACI